jgi:thiol:disulfide interchange protein/DsbC/DsbD-like thiol-disulfide interchange protein
MRCRRSVTAYLAALLSVASVAATTTAQAQVDASLVAADASVRPGESVTVALRLTHHAPWHTYWLNPGTGEATAIEWQLPQGWTAGEIEWPTPVIIRGEGDKITGHGYGGDLYLPVKVTAPLPARAGAVAVLRANVHWLMCAEVCIPKDVRLALPIPVRDVPSKPNSQVRAALANMPMPRTPVGWHYRATRGAHTVTLEVSGAGALANPHFFSASELIRYDGLQRFDASTGRLLVTLPIDEYLEDHSAELTGLLAYTDGAGAYTSVQVRAPLLLGASAPATPVRESAAAAGGVLPTLLLALVGGFILNFMPCVFPVLGIKVLGFVNQAGRDRGQVALHGLAFTLGVVLSFQALAIILAVLRTSGQELGWGFQLQSPEFVFCLAAVTLVFALSLSGLFDFGVKVMGIGSGLATKAGFAGSFFSGVLAATVATPCSAPFLGPALGVALTLPVGASVVVLTAVALGLALPHLALSIFPSALRALPRPGRWMETFKQATAFPLYATSAYLVWVLAGQIGENGHLMSLLGLTVIAMAAWLYGRYAGSGEPARRWRFGCAGALVLLSIGLATGWPRTPAPDELVWGPWSEARVAQLRADGRAIYVDFTARWCATCQANKKIVFGSEAVRQRVRARQVALLKADWTNRDPIISAELARWNQRAIPLNLVYLPGVGQPSVLPAVLTPQIVLKALER